MANEFEVIARNLATNMESLRKKRGMTQGDLAQVAAVPRSTITYLESGQSNPSLQNLAKLSGALQVTIEELIATPRGRYQLVKSGQLKPVKRGQGTVNIFELLPDPITGMHMDRMEFEIEGRMVGIPHVSGTKEYLTCLQGEVTVRTAGQIFRVQKGDVLAFPGDQPHAYENTGSGKTLCLSVVVLAPSGI